MNKSLSIAIGGMNYFIEEDAYEKLKYYLDSIRASLHNNKDVDEIIEDVENRIAEILSEKRETGKEVLNTADIDTVIDIMGEPKDFSDSEEEAEKVFSDTESSSTSQKDKAAAAKKLYRDPDDKILGGVCSGVGYYLGVDSLWIRVVMVILFFGFGVGVIPYIIAWILIPLAKTTSEKLEMRGRPANFDNIKEFFDFESESFKKNKDKVTSGINQTGRTLGDVIEKLFFILIKVIGVFVGIILCIIGISLIISYLFGIIPWNIGEFNSFELFGIIMENNAQITIAIILLGVAMIIPAIFLIMLGMSIISNRLNPKIHATTIITSLVLWVLAIGGLIFISLKVGSNFNIEVNKNEAKTLNNTSDTLAVRFIERGEDLGIRINQNSITIGNRIDGISKDGSKYLYSLNHTIKLEESFDDQFHLLIKKESKGKSPNDAQKNLEEIIYTYKVDSLGLALDDYFSMQNTAKYRFQDVDFVIQIPKNKVLKIKNASVFTDKEWDGYYDQFDDASSIKLFKFVDGKLQCLNCPKEENENNDIHIDVNVNGEEGKVQIDKNGIDIKSEDGKVKINSKEIHIQHDTDTIRINN